MIEFIEGSIILIVPLLIICIFLIKWHKDYKRTKKLFVLYDKKIKRWQFLIAILFLISSVFVISSAVSVIGEKNDAPIQITPEQYGPWA